MTVENKISQEQNDEVTRQQLEDLVIETDSGARRPESKLSTFILLFTAFIWSLFQLWIASPLPFKTNFLILDDTKVRSIHLGFAVFLAFLAYPAFKTSPNNKIPLTDWFLALLGAFCSSYLFLFYNELSNRPGFINSYFLRELYSFFIDYYANAAVKPEWLPSANMIPEGGLDFEVAVVGMLLLIEATRRSLGIPLVIIATVFLAYSIFGNSSFVPDLIRYKGASMEKIAGHQWLTTEGVYGIALGVSASFVFLFVLFGALLDKAGAGNYFIKVAFSILGHLRGGPAKAAVLSSALTGIISGSSIANTVTTGTFTIPLMKRVGFSGSKAGAVEVASSVNGQIMPPVMGAAAFLMVEYVGIPYTDVVKHAFIPAIISYIALLYIVHLEALKQNMQGLEKPINRTFIQSFSVTMLTIVTILIICSGSYHLINTINNIAGDYAFEVITSFLGISYVAILYLVSKNPDLEQDNPNDEIIELPRTLPTVLTGLHYLLPIATLIWCLMIEKLSPGLSAFWATSFMIVIMFTQKPIKEFFRKTHNYKRVLKESFVEFLDGMISGARNMIGIAVATAAAGIIVGTVSLTGVGQVLTEVVEVLSGGSLILILIFTALICLILGMGLPTTANYIVVASLMAKVVVDLGAQNGLFVPLVAVHLFVFYFGIMADVTPPVGLASFAAAAISGDDPLKTGVQAFVYSLRTAILPFFFIFNNEIILIGVDGIGEMIFVFLYSVFAIIVFSSALQGYLVTRSKFLESLVLLLVAITIFVPSIWSKLLLPPYETVQLDKFFETVEHMDTNSRVKINIEATDFDGNKHEFFSYIPSTIKQDNVQKTLKRYGIKVNPVIEDNKLAVTYVVFNSMAEKSGFDTMNLDEFYITSVEKPYDPGFNQKWLYVPAVIFFIFVYMIQSVRKKREQALGEV